MQTDSSMEMLMLGGMLKLIDVAIPPRRVSTRREMGSIKAIHRGETCPLVKEMKISHVGSISIDV